METGVQADYPPGPHRASLASPVYASASGGGRRVLGRGWVMPVALASSGLLLPPCPFPPRQGPLVLALPASASPHLAAEQLLMKRSLWPARLGCDGCTS